MLAREKKYWVWEQEQKWENNKRVLEVAERNIEGCVVWWCVKSAKKNTTTITTERI